MLRPLRSSIDGWADVSLGVSRLAVVWAIVLGAVMACVDDVFDPDPAPVIRSMARSLISDMDFWMFVRSRLTIAAFISEDVDRAWAVELEEDDEEVDELEDEEVMWWCRRCDFFSTRVVVVLLLLLLLLLTT